MLWDEYGLQRLPSARNANGIEANNACEVVPCTKALQAGGREFCVLEIFFSIFYIANGIKITFNDMSKPKQFLASVIPYRIELLYPLLLWLLTLEITLCPLVARFRIKI